MAQNRDAEQNTNFGDGATSRPRGGTLDGATSHTPKGREEPEVPEGFTLSLALVDALPVIFFCLAAIVLGTQLQSPLFVVGAVVAFCGGAGKVAWKLVIALVHKNVPLLNRQMRIVMPAGFLLMIIGAALRAGAFSGILARLVQLPSLVFLLLWLACMVAMGYFAGHRQQNDAHSNWIEQGVNAVGQAALLVALLLA